MATVNITIHDTGSQQDSPTLLKEVVPGDPAPANGGVAPGSGDNATAESSLTYGESVPGNGVVDIGAPPAWLHEAIAADKAATAAENTDAASGTDGGAAPKD